jgi:hypothetical protein
MTYNPSFQHNHSKTITEDLLQGLWATRINVPPDLIQSLRGTETHTRNDYLGRVVFEFFQNAVDRAERRIDITLEATPGEASYQLVVANDGKPVSIEALNDPVTLRFSLPSGDIQELATRYGAELHSDFQALCNIHNSTKKAGQSIGNKGVGFKSAWEFARSITIASTLPDGQRYAFCFHQTLNPIQVRDTTCFWPGLDARLREAAAKLLEGTQGLPSFYFPEHCVDAEVYFIGREWAKTVIILEGIDEDRRIRLEDRIEEFRQTPLFFINQLRGQDGRKRPSDIKVTTHFRGKSQIQSTRVPGDWMVVDETLLADLWSEQKEALCDAARELNFIIEQPSLAIAFPPERQRESDVMEEDENCSRFFCYLPTYVDCGFGVQIHADFMLDMSRKHIEVGQNPYNKALLHLSGRLLGRALMSLPDLHVRTDVMGFLLPGKASNPAAEELKRGLALELHLPMEKTADPATMRTFLAAVFPPSRPTWPEIRYIQTLAFLRIWCVRHYGEWNNSFRQRIQPFINLLREQQTPILPERSENGVVRVALPLPNISSEGRLSGGRGIFWHRKLDREGAETIPLEISLADTKIEGLAVTEWDKLSDSDKKLLGLLDFNLSEIAQRLRIHIETLVRGGEVVQSESLPFRPEAVLRFVVGLLLRSEKIDLDHVQPLEFLSSPGKIADNLSKMLLPVKGGGWRLGREVRLSDNTADNLVTRLGGSSSSPLDMERFKSCVHVTDQHQATQFALALGVWPCLHLTQIGETWRLPFDLADLEAEGLRESFYQSFIHAWRYWSQADQDIAKQIAHVLETSATPWLPLDSAYNTSLNRYARPLEVLLVNERDRKRQSFLLKKVAANVNEQTALEAVGVVSATDASLDKLLVLLAFMSNGSASDEELRGRYRTLMLELARRGPTEQGQEKLKALPLLVSQANSRHWFSAEQGNEIWFVPRTSQHLRKEFRDECSFLDLDMDTPQWLIQILGARQFSPVLQMGSGDPEALDFTPPVQCVETKDRLQSNYLADLMLIAEGSAVGGGTRTREVIVDAWRKLICRRGERVWVKASLDGRERFIGKDIDHIDVLLNDSDGALEIWHDAPLAHLDKHLHLFAEPLASGVFGNRLLIDAFAAYLGAGERQEYWLADRYGITDDERGEMRSYLMSEFLSGEILDQLVEALYTLPEWQGKAIDKEELRTRWWDMSFYLGHSLALDAPGLHDRLPPHLAERFPLIDPTMINKRRWEQSIDKEKLHKAILTALLDAGTANLQTETARKLELLLVVPKDLSRFDFDPYMEQQQRIADHFGIDMNYLKWSERQKTFLNWLSAERILSGDIQDVAVLSTPFATHSSSKTTISNVSQSATRKIKKTNQTEREQKTRDNHRAGVTAEHSVAIASVRNLLNNPDIPSQWAEVLRVWRAVQGEFDNLPDLPLYCPQDPHDLVRFLHVAFSFGDGLGFDVIEIGSQLSDVWLAEVKSAAGGRLFLSENERLKALRYEEVSVLKGRWRLKVWLGDGKWADDQLTHEVIDAFNDIKTRLAGNQFVKPEGWVFQLDVR